MIAPGHRGLLFDTKSGLRRELLNPGYHHLGMSERIDDFDVTFTSRKEALHLLSAEGLPFDVGMTVIYRPIIAELYELDTEVGAHYYDEVVGPEFRSATRACFARHSYVDLVKATETLEDEVERDVRKRVMGKHVEISSVTVENIALPPELANTIRARQIVEQRALLKKAETERAWEQEKVELEHAAERRRLAAP